MLQTRRSRSVAVTERCRRWSSRAAFLTFACRCGAGAAPLAITSSRLEGGVIRKLKSGEYRLYSRKKDPKTGKRRNLGTFRTRAAAERHERAVQYFKRRG